MSVYLKDIPASEAKDRFQSALRIQHLWDLLGKEEIPLNENSIGRVTAEPVFAKISSPHYHASAMDGFAVRAEDTFGARPTKPISLIVKKTNSISSKFSAHYLDTGDLLPEGFNAVIPIENVESLDENGEITSAIRKPDSIRIRAAVTPWAHIRVLGEDIVQTQLIIPAGQVLRPVDLGAAAAAGLSSVLVSRQPRVAIIPTGSELVPIGSKLKPGDILEYNSLILAAQIKAWGGNSTRFPITPDDFDAICTCVKEASRGHDLILLNAGSSAGAEDFSAQVVQKLGTLLVHGVAVRPGHPVIFGLIRRDAFQKNVSDEKDQDQKMVPIIGVPGFPVSATLTGEIFIEPLIARWTGRHQMELPKAQAYLTRKITSQGGDDDFVRVSLGMVGDKLRATPLTRGAGVISSLVRADGLLLIQRGIQGIEAGEPVEVSLYRTMAELNRTIFCIGSHDMTLDLLAKYLTESERRLISANVGSLGGIIALKKGEAHMAGAHLLDPETGEYNLSYIRRYLSGIPTVVFGFVGREQGLIVKRGNPKGIKNLTDLIRKDISFINRQHGSGTRVLLDYNLEKLRINKDSIKGYDQEEFTHLAVSAAVASGRADCTLGIPAAAQVLELDFIPLFQEAYQLLIPRIFAQSDLLSPVLDILNSQDFKQAVKDMPGYDIGQMGKPIAELA